MQKILKLETIQALRGVAALLVVFYHFFACFNIHSAHNIPEVNKAVYPIAHALFGKGFFGVDLFFVLSGFILFYSLKSYDIKRFILHRISRIYPVFFIAFIVALVTLEPQLLHNGVGTILQQLFFIPTGTHPPLYSHAIIIVLWTLNYEIYFYAIMALSLLFGKHWFKVINIYFAVTLILVPLYSFGLISLSSIGYNFTTLGMRFITNPILYEFCLGLWIAYIIYAKEIRFDKIYKVITPLGLITFLLLYLFLPDQAVKYGLTSIGAFAPFIVLFVAYRDLNLNSKFKLPRFASTLGDMSYSLYIWHTVVLEILYRQVYPHVPSVTAEHNVIYYRGDPGIVFFIFYMTITLFISYLSYQYIERYIIQKLRKS